MIKKIDALIEELEKVCDEFDYITEEEPNWRTASRISFYREHVDEGITYLRKMQEYLATLTDWQLEQLHEGYSAE